MGKMTKPTESPRLRLGSSIDFSKIDPGCPRCKGTGQVGAKEIDNPENPGETIRVPVGCRCIRENGGVQKDMLDEFMASTSQQLADGTFAENLASDIIRLPPKSRPGAIEQLEKMAQDKSKDAKVRKQVMVALGLILRRTKREARLGLT
jgi:hypothetical protein